MSHFLRTFSYYKNKYILDILFNFFSKEIYLKYLFKQRVGYPLNLDNPKTYNEKLQWLKLHDIHAEYTQMVDKVDAKEYVKNIVGEKYIIPTIAIWEDVDSIDWEGLPNQFVIKVTSDSGGIVVCKDKSQLNIELASQKLKKGWGRNYFERKLEYPYKNVKPRIIAEDYIEDETGELRDFKIFCFDGEPKALFVATDRQKKGVDTKFDFFDLEWNHLPFTNGHPNSSKAIEKPLNFDEMIDVARKLSKGIPHVRVDLYNVNGKSYFGELTFFHWSGMTAFDPIEWDFKFGQWIKLPQ